MKQSFITKEDIFFQLANPHQITFEITNAYNLKCNISNGMYLFVSNIMSKKQLSYYLNIT